MPTVGERRKRLPANWPYARAVETARKKALCRSDYDPAVLVVWGQMQAMGLLATLKAVERRFGAEGQEVCRQAIASVGYDVGRQLFEGVAAPDEMSDAEVFSLFATWVNEVAYASIEEPAIDGPDECHFDILYCPHEDTYDKFDCRVQRYFVEGMVDAAVERLGRERFDVFFDHSMQQGYPTCRFHIKRRSTETGDPWKEYTEALQRKALERASGEGD